MILDYLIIDRVDRFRRKALLNVDFLRVAGGMHLCETGISLFIEFDVVRPFERPAENQLLAIVIGLLQRNFCRCVGEYRRLDSALRIGHAVQLFIIGLRAARVALGLHSGKGRLK